MKTVLHFAAACARGGNEGPFLQTDVCFPRAVEECAASRSSNVYGAGPARPQHQTYDYPAEKNT